jgi:hypothetical protein
MRIILTLTLVGLLWFPTTAQIYPDQFLTWGFGLLAQPHTLNRVTEEHHLINLEDRNSELIPYTVPPGQCLGLTGVKFSSKFREERSSYLTIGAIDTIMDHQGMQPYPHPIVLPSGTTLFGEVNYVTFANNSREQQWMNGLIFAVQRPCPAFTSRQVYRTIFSDWFRR